MDTKEVRTLFKRFEKSARRIGSVGSPDPIFVIKHESGTETIVPQARQILGLSDDDYLQNGLSSKQTALTEMLFMAYEMSGPISSVLFMCAGCKGIVPKNSEATHIIINEQTAVSFRTWYGKIKKGKKISIGEPELSEKPDAGFVPTVIGQVLNAITLGERDSATIH